MTKTEYKKIVNDHITREFDITAFDASDIDIIAEQLTDEVAAIAPVETDEDRDTLTAAVYEIIKEHLNK